tara:strand:- start:94 stop:363 length:270 start_codon:yes stop_codon:yes gene_type:complete
MSEDIQNNEMPLSESEKEQLNEVIQLNQQLQNAFGALGIRKIQLEADEESLKQQLSAKNQKEIEISRKINDKYGVGSVDLEKGVFIKQD